MSPDGKMLQAALAYAQRFGWPVFPLSPGTKIPHRGTHGCNDASADPETIRRWWASWPGANVGLACGAAGLVAIDLDVKGGASGIETWRRLKAQHSFDDDTLTSLTPSGGRHLIFRCPEGVTVRNSAGKLGPGVDVRGQGGHIVLPPSVIAGGDHPGAYAWDTGAYPNDRQPAPLPRALVRLLARREHVAVSRVRGPFIPPPSEPCNATAYASAALKGELEALASTGEGARNDRLNRAAFALSRFVAAGQLDRGEVEARLEAAALATGLGDDANCGPRGIRATIRSGLEAGLRQPRELPGGGRPRRAATTSPRQAPPTPDPGPVQASGSEISIQPTPGCYPLTDYGNAERLVARHGRELRYCHPWGRWLVWDGRRWRPDDTAGVARRAKETVRLIYGEATQAVDEDRRKAIAKWAARSEAKHRLQAMIDLAQSEPGIPVLPGDLDTHPWLLTVDNGTLDLRTGELLPHDPAHLITKLAPVAYDAEATAPTWDAFLKRIMAGNGDLIRFLQRAVGYALTGDTREQVLFILCGTGANGKSTLLAALSDLLADYALKTPTETLLLKHGRGIPNDVARLRGARLVTAVEAEEGQRMAESLVKQMTGGDRIAARFLHREWFEFVPEFKLFLATNHRPVIRGTDHAMWRRIRLVPFAVTIPEAEQDRTLGNRLRAELPGILAWALRGCLAWQQQGLGVPPEVQQATADYRSEMDVLAGFLDDCCLLKPTARVTVKALYEAYAEWCRANGERPLSKWAFGSRLKGRGFSQRRASRGNRYWRGIGLLSEPQQRHLPDPASGREVIEL